MKAYLCRWPNGRLSIVAADDENEVVREVRTNLVCPIEEVLSGDGVIMELPKGFHVHLQLAEDGQFEFYRFGPDARGTLERLYPHLMALYDVGFKTEEEADAAAAKAAAIECGKDSE